MITSSVLIEFDASDIAPEVYSDLFEALADHAPGVGPAQNGNLSARILIRTETALQAVTVALDIVGAAVRELGLPDTVVGIEQVTEAELDRRLAEPQVPDLAGVAEAAAILEVAKQQIVRLVERGELKPVQTLAGGAVFAADTVRAFRVQKHSRKMGRPVKDLGLSPAERSLLNSLVAAAGQPSAGGSRGSTPASPIANVYSDARVRVHHGEQNPEIAAALSTLAEHRLVTVLRLPKAQQATGDPHDVLVKVLDKGIRQAAAGTGDTTA